MNSFTLFAVGNLAKDPEQFENGDTTYTKFALIGNDFAGKGKKEVQTSIYFVAFNGMGEAIAKHARKGDQLIIEAQVRANNWKDEDKEMHYDYSFIVQGFTFGAPGKAKREEFAER